MKAELLQRRQAASDRHDAALARWPDRMGDAFTAELKAVVAELDRLAREADVPRSDLLECARTWRYLGDAYFDLARGRDTEILKKGGEAYRRAEALLGSVENAVEQAKLNFNFANTLRGLSRGMNREQLQEARLRYKFALDTFELETDLAKFVPQVKQALTSLDAQLSLTRGSAGVSPDSEQAAKRRLKAFKAEGRGFSSVRREVLKILDSLKGLAAGSPASFDTVVLEQMQREFTATLDAGAPGGEAALFRHLFRPLKDKFRAEIASGKVGRERQQALEPLLNELEDLLDQNPQETDELMAGLGQMRELMRRITPLMATASYGEKAPPADSRAAQMLERIGALAAFVAGDRTRHNLSPSEKRVATELLIRMGKAGTDFHECQDPNAEALALEREVLRQLALDVQAWALRHHLMLASPVWPAPPVSLDPSLVFFSGSSPVGKAVQAACQPREMIVANRTSGRNVEQARWDDLRKAGVAIFDLTVEPGPPLAAVCFEVGMAQALGKPTVILANRARPVPFDIVSEPFELAGSNEDLGMIREAVDTALYGISRREEDSSVAASIAFARQQFETSDTSFEVRHVFKLLDDADCDPIEVRRLMETLQGYLGMQGTQLLYSIWPGVYPDPEQKRCFHVMPFGPTWANEVMNSAEQACDRAGVEYVHGDQAADPRIIRSIWDGICRATHVLVDLTGFNANVALELGMALTLGKKTLIMGQGDTVEHLFPSIAKLRVHRYQLGDGMQSLRDLISRHVQR